MGADLCGYIYVGPSEFTDKQWARAHARILFLQHTAQEILNTLDTGEEINPEVHAYQQLYEVGEAQGMDDLLEIAGWVQGLDADDIMGGIASMWYAQFRDVMKRPLDELDRHGKWIVVTGDRTWGDGPEPGSGWWYASLLTTLGLEPLLGIE